MPLYDYHCEQCDKNFEVLRRRGDDRPVPCPECGQDAERQLSSFALGSSGAAFSSFGSGSSSGGSHSGCGSSGGG